MFVEIIVQNFPKLITDNKPVKALQDYEVILVRRNQILRSKSSK